MEQNVKFTATDASKGILKQVPSLASAAQDEFFALWESENDPRKAGSIVAHRYVHAGATIAVFGAMCDGRKPDKELWLAACAERFDQAVADCNLAFNAAEIA